MIRSVIALLAVLATTGCSGDRELQGKIYLSLSQSVKLPDDADERLAAIAVLKKTARLPEDAVMFSSDIYGVPVREKPEDFYDSVIFVRTTIFSLRNLGDFILKEDIYVFSGERAVTLKRQLINVLKEEVVFEEVYPGALRP